MVLSLINPHDICNFTELFAVNPDGRMLRFGNYKYIHSQIYGQEYEILFDLEADTDETSNLFGQAGYETISLAAHQRLDEWLHQKNLSLTFEPI